MRLIDYMRAHALDDVEMARRVGNVTEHGIRKVKYGQRNPSLRLAARIEIATGGAVRPSDLLLAEDAA